MKIQRRVPQNLLINEQFLDVFSSFVALLTNEFYDQNCIYMKPGGEEKREFKFMMNK